MGLGGRTELIMGQALVMLGTIVALTLFGEFTITWFIIGSFIGLLVIVEYTASTAIQLRWRLRLRWVLLVGVVAFGAIVLEQLFVLGA